MTTWTAVLEDGTLVTVNDEELLHDIHDYVTPGLRYTCTVPVSYRDGNGFKLKRRYIINQILGKSSD